METANINHLWASLIIEELARCGVHHILIAPGSRSTPLAVAAARNDRVSTLVHYDERGAAFAALGCGKRGNTAAVICSSGTAVANCFPAVAEACLSATPLIILSADRPPEMQGCGANQTMQQQEFFGEYTRLHETLSCPDTSITAASLLTIVNDLVDAAGLPGNGGAVHLNCMYREPLAPTPEPWPSTYLNELAAWESTDAPYTSPNKPLLLLSPVQLKHIVAELQNAQCGLLLIGRLSTTAEYAAARKLAADIPWPVFADIGSHCRFDSSNNTNIHCYDSLLRSESFRNFCSPDFILHIGDVFVSKRLQEHLATIHPDYIHLHPRDDNRDPVHRVTQHYQVDIATACDQLLNTENLTFPPSALLAKFQAANQSVSVCIDTYIKNEDTLSEITVASIIKTICPVGTSLFIGNSMPIRDMDTVVDRCNAGYIGVNRGVSGIDGNIATAAGMAWASDTLTLALIGDTTALHDLNSLALLNKTGAQVILVIINNGGGGIFSFLPIAQEQDLLDTYFTNAHALRFEKAAALFILPYYCAGTATELEQHLQAAINDKKSAIIEVVVDLNNNIQAHQALAALVEQETAPFFSE